MSFASREERTRRARLGGPGQTERGEATTARQRRAVEAQQNVQLNFAPPLRKQTDSRVGVKTDESLRVDAQERLTVVPFLQQERGILVAQSTTGVGGGELDRTWVVQGKVDTADQMRLVTSTTAGYTAGVQVRGGRVFYVNASLSVAGGSHTLRVRATDLDATTAGAVIGSSTGGNRHLTVHALVDLRSRPQGAPVVIHVSHQRVSGTGGLLAQFLTIQQVA